ncbi:metallophosphoesterase [Flavobacterium akiainvivens]|uniref:Metallophosphoesterase n=1 Tax=Flavobacterium akiainvivens TaxID=1202724 RepID=A0A0M8MH60_9FLAO|nr:calcineurin-like phosphoesterase family protein [Flavobacterium akiainvivens]KOS05508.1 metallophosphoesterase [Flavobacterium akiainvivens]SFQ33331.1 Calcineurin-like phosphoesterase [Flavobacterium akiainvivens]
MKKLLWPVGMLLIAASVSAQTTAKGFIYNDANGNGKKDRSEKGIANVAVTNGHDVVTTDANGAYALTVGTDNIISVIKPAGYKINTNPNNQPVFYYIHKPQGSPKLKHTGVAPTGNLPKEINFGLVQQTEPDNFTALLFGDPQAYNMDEIDYFTRGVVAEVQGIKNVAFGLSMGDLVGNDPTLFNPYIQAVKKVGIPWYNLIGNHDLNFDATDDTYSDESYEASFGSANYAFNYGKTHFIVLDDVIYPDPRDNEGYWGGFSQSQLAFIENDLKQVPKDRLIVLAMHIPLSEPWDDAFRDEDRTRLFEILKDFPYTLSLSAHTHLQKQDFFTRKEGWQQDTPHHHYNMGTTSGDWYSGQLNEQGIPVSTMRDGTPKGYAFIHFTGNTYKVDYKVAGKPKDYQIEVFAPKLVSRVKKNKAFVYANFFMGREGDKVQYRIDGGEWKDMDYNPKHDPTYTETIMEWDTTEKILSGRRGNDPEDCMHLWKGKLPHNLAEGNHKIEIKATDMYGNTYSAASSYKLAGKE